jgi:hypothetical protein
VSDGALFVIYNIRKERRGPAAREKARLENSKNRDKRSLRDCTRSDLHLRTCSIRASTCNYAHLESARSHANGVLRTRDMPSRRAWDRRSDAAWRGNRKNADNPLEVRGGLTYYPRRVDTSPSKAFYRLISAAPGEICHTRAYKSLPPLLRVMTGRATLDAVCFHSVNHLSRRCVDTDCRIIVLFNGIMVRWAGA